MNEDQANKDRHIRKGRDEIRINHSSHNSITLLKTMNKGLCDFLLQMEPVMQRPLVQKQENQQVVLVQPPAELQRSYIQSYFQSRFYRLCSIVLHLPVVIWLNIL